MLRLNVLSARNVDNGADDARFCVVRVGPTKSSWEHKRDSSSGELCATQWRSLTVPQSRDIDFDFALSFDSRDAGAEEIHVRIYDGGCSVLGELVVPARSFHAKRYVLAHSPRRGAKIVVSTSQVRVLEEPVRGRAEASVPVERVRSVPAPFRISVGAAEGIRDADRFGSSDCYCVVRVGGASTSWMEKFSGVQQQQWRSLTQVNAKGSPSFEMHFYSSAVLVPVDEALDSVELQVRVYDEDHDEDDYLGEVCIPLQPIDAAMHALVGRDATGTLMLTIAPCDEASNAVVHGTVQSFGEKRRASLATERSSRSGSPTIPDRAQRPALVRSTSAQRLREDATFDATRAGWLFRLRGDDALFDGRGQEWMRQAVFGGAFRALRPAASAAADAAAGDARDALHAGQLVEFAPQASVAAGSALARDGLGAARVGGTFTLAASTRYEVPEPTETSDASSDSEREDAALVELAHARWKGGGGEAQSGAGAASERGGLYAEVRSVARAALCALLGLGASSENVVLSLTSSLDSSDEGVAARMRATLRVSAAFVVTWEAFAYAGDAPFDAHGLDVLQTRSTAAGALAAQLDAACRSQLASEVRISSVAPVDAREVCSRVEPAAARSVVRGDGGGDAAVRATVVSAAHGVFRGFATVATVGSPSATLLVRRAALRVVADDAPTYERWDPPAGRIDSLPAWAIAYRSVHAAELGAVRLSRAVDRKSWEVSGCESAGAAEHVLLRGVSTVWASAEGASSMRPSDLTWQYRTRLKTWYDVPGLRLVRWTPPERHAIDAARSVELAASADASEAEAAAADVMRAPPSVPLLPPRKSISAHHLRLMSPRAKLTRVGSARLHHGPVDAFPAKSPPPPPIPSRSVAPVVPSRRGSVAAPPVPRRRDAEGVAARAAAGGTGRVPERSPDAMLAVERNMMMKHAGWALRDLVDSPVADTVNAMMGHRRAPLTARAAAMVTDTMYRRGDQLRFVSAWGEEGEDDANWG